MTRIGAAVAATVLVGVILVSCSRSTATKSRTFTIVRTEDTFVDASRSTPANGTVPGHAGRTLVTSIWYPTHGGGPFPLIVFAPGFGTPPDLDGYATLLAAWAAAGFVVAADAGRRLTADARSGDATLAQALPGGPPVILPTPTTSAPTLHADVTPTQGLHDGEDVTVSWRGFRPDVSVNVLECDRNPPSGPGDCGLQSAKLLIPDPIGSGSVALPVHATIPGVGSCGTTTPRCVVVVNQGGSTSPSSSVAVPIAFSSP